MQYVLGGTGEKRNNWNNVVTNTSVATSFEAFNLWIYSNAVPTFGIVCGCV